MTILSHLSPRELSDRLDALERKAKEDEPDPRSAEAAAAIDEATESVRTIFREYGFAAPGDDRCRNLESVIFWYLTAANPGVA